jgi:hypothetical protein
VQIHSIPSKGKKAQKKHQQLVLHQKNGAGDEIRTHDIHLGKVALYH